MERQTLETFGAAETFALGEKIGRGAAPGDIYCLEGDLGAGKTVLAQGIAAGLGITEPVNSPTFTVLQVHEDGRLPLYHFDAYRLEEPEELYEIGAEEYFFGQGVSVIEWPSQIEELIPETAVWVCLEKDLGRGTEYRRVTICRSEGEA